MACRTDSFLFLKKHVYTAWASQKFILVGDQGPPLVRHNLILVAEKLCPYWTPAATPFGPHFLGRCDANRVSIVPKAFAGRALRDSTATFRVYRRRTAPVPVLQVTARNVVACNRIRSSQGGTCGWGRVCPTIIASADMRGVNKRPTAMPRDASW